MSVVSAVSTPTSFEAPTIKESHIGYKILTCIPVVGIFMQIMERSLSSKIECSHDKQRKIELLDIKKNFNLCAIIRDVVTIAAVVAFLVLNIWGLIPVAILGAISLTSIILNSYWLQKNLHAIRDNKNQLQLQKITPQHYVESIPTKSLRPPALSSLPVNRVLDFSSSPALTLSSLPSPLLLPKPSYKYNLQTPFHGVKTFSLDTNDALTQEPLAELAEKNVSLGMNYYIAFTKDINGGLAVFDGCSFLRHYFEFDKRENPLNRQRFTHIEYYCLSSMNDKAINHFCSLKDLENPKSGKMLKKLIGATSTDASAKERVGSDQASVGLAYEMGDDLVKKDPKEALNWYKRAAENNSFYAYMRLADYLPTNDFKGKQEHLYKARAHCEVAYFQSKQEYGKVQNLLQKLDSSSADYKKLEKLLKYLEETYLYNKMHLGMIYSEMGKVEWKLSKGKDKMIAIGFIVESGNYLPEEDFQNLVSIFHHTIQEKIMIEFTKQTHKK